MVTRNGQIDAAVEIFGPATEQPAIVVRSPGRVNLIGDHIDYSGGLVLPMALDRGTTAVFLPRTEPVVRGYSENFPDIGVVSARLGATGFDPDHEWFSYVLAVVDTAAGEGFTPTHGFDIYLTGNIPEGGGLSSSASVEMAVAVGLEAQFGFGLDATGWAQLCQRAENSYIGVASGIMDQLAIAQGRAGNAILMNCASLECRYVPMPVDLCTVVIANTNHRRQLADSAYNERRAAVDRAFDVINAESERPFPDLVSVDLATLDRLEPALAEQDLLAAARHSITEHQRVIAAAEALAAGDLARVGALMRQSHESLRDDFRVTGPHLDALAEAAWATPGVIGARMTGAGFGGCTVNLIENSAVESASAEISRRYLAATGVAPELFAVTPSDGAAVR